jgi:hypothetical protein
MTVGSNKCYTGYTAIILVFLRNPSGRPHRFAVAPSPQRGNSRCRASVGLCGPLFVSVGLSNAFRTLIRFLSIFKCENDDLDHFWSPGGSPSVSGNLWKPLGASGSRSDPATR